jgi:ABC-type dipeptide/oligopeptide/nickel transport system ATPase component
MKIPSGKTVALVGASGCGSKFIYPSTISISFFLIRKYNNSINSTIL